MRLRRLDLTRYGKFTDATIDFGEAPEAGGPDLHVVYGLNEAGKSTALNATLDLLFGIEHASRYGFLHPYAAMEVGACLDIGDARHELVRRKAKTGSLADPAGRPANEALIAGALSGLGRDAYRTMFSLDDETLEEGGNAILQSRGDLGELLFSASAGLAQIGGLLAKAAAEAEAIHRRRAQSTEIAGLKRRLAELKSRRETLDTAAPAYGALEQAAARAAGAYAAAMAERGRVKADLDRHRRLAEAGPEADRYGALLESLAAYEGLPRPPERWARELPALMQAETRNATRIEAARERAAALSREIERLAPDEAVLALGPEIAALGEALARFATAEEDLPRRRASLAEREARLSGLLDRLGQGGHANPAALLPPAAVLGTLRDLIEARSGVEARLRTAEAELAEAGDAFEAARREADRFAADGSGDAAGENAFAALDAVLRRLRRSDAAARLRLASLALPEARRRRDEALAALAPMPADISALAALAVPDARRLEAWRARLADLDRRRARHRDRLRERQGEAADAAARRAALENAAGAIDDAAAAALRKARAKAWDRHAARLDADTASVFAEALSADDRIVEARLSRSQDLAELRQLAGVLGVAEAGMRTETERLAEVAAEAESLAAEIGAALPAGLAGAGESPEARLDRIEDFTARRARALEAGAALSEAEDAAARAFAEADEDRHALLAAFQPCRDRAASDLPMDAPLADLLERAEALLARRRAEGTQAAAALRALAEREAALERRRRERRAAADARKDWQARFDAALSGTWIEAGATAGAVREILEVLTLLGPALRERDDMRHRIETMTADQAALTGRLGALLARLGEGPGALLPPEAVARLAERLRLAERETETLLARRREREAEVARAEALEEERRLVAAEKAEMTALFGVETLAEVAPALERAAERARLEHRLAEVGASLAANMRAAGPEAALDALAAVDRAEAERMAGELEARHEDLDGRTRDLFAEMSRAADALAAVGGDDAVARLQLERQTVLMEIEEAALRHLRLRAGTLVAEEALRAFRDRHRSTMMGRASEAFAAMTRGDYTGLSARPDKDRETLIGLPREGGSKLAADMSKGTRFQLYLALRLAGYEEFAAARPPVPFLADDIMETFDEPRSEEVLRRLAALSRIGQVVYFTHHRHLCDIAEAVEPLVRVHRL